MVSWSWVEEDTSPRSQMGVWAGQKGGATMMLVHFVKKNISPFKVFMQNVSYYLSPNYVLKNVYKVGD